MEYQSVQTSWKLASSATFLLFLIILSMGLFSPRLRKGQCGLSARRRCWGSIWLIRIYDVRFSKHDLHRPSGIMWDDLPARRKSRRSLQSNPLLLLIYHKLFIGAQWSTFQDSLTLAISGARIIRIKPITLGLSWIRSYYMMNGTRYRHTPRLYGFGLKLCFVLYHGAGLKESL
jgi:hypothetical protein